MALVACSQHKAVGDTSMFCFVNADGSHHSPRECRCLMVRDSDRGDWERWIPGADMKRRYASAEMPDDVFKQQMIKKFGKENPDCPIGDDHAPIDPRTRKPKADAVKVAR